MVLGFNFNTLSLEKGWKLASVFYLRRTKKHWNPEISAVARLILFVQRFLLPVATLATLLLVVPKLLLIKMFVNLYDIKKSNCTFHSERKRMYLSLLSVQKQKWKANGLQIGYRSGLDFQIVFQISFCLQLGFLLNWKQIGCVCLDIYVIDNTRSKKLTKNPEIKKSNLGMWYGRMYLLWLGFIIKICRWVRISVFEVSLFSQISDTFLTSARESTWALFSVF